MGFKYPFRTITLATLTGISLCACGFTPMHGNIARNDSSKARAHAADFFQTIKIQTIPNREGQILYNHLIDQLNRLGYPSNPKYVLEVTDLTESESDLDLSQSDNATRSQLRVSAVMTLKSLDNNQTLLSRKLRSITSYNVLNSEFATRISEQSTRENAYQILAQKIETQLGLYFNKQP